MMTRVMMATAAVLMLGLVSCGPPPGPGYGGAMGPGGCPAWVDGASKPSKYPEMMYLTAVGTTTAGTECKNDAYAAMSKIFNAHVSQVNQEYQSYRSKVNAAGGSMREEATSIQSLTRVSTEKALNAVEVKDSVSCNSAQYCLAALDRAIGKRNIEEALTKVDAEISALIATGDQASSTAQKFMKYTAAMERTAERQVLNMDLRIVAQNAGLPAPWDITQLIAKFTGSAARVRVGLKLSGMESAKLQTCLAEGLNRKGLKVMEGTSDVEAMIHATLKYQKAGYIEGSEMVRADINLRVTDMQNGQTLTAFNDSVKVGRPTLAASIQLAVAKLCDKAVEELPQKIFDSFKR